MTSRWADELAFATELARRAGSLLIDSYERLERIDYKSKRDVVTNADYASEKLVIDAIRTTSMATRSWPRSRASMPASCATTARTTAGRG